MTSIESQNKVLQDQVSLLEKLSKEGTEEQYLIELQKYELMLKGADFSIEVQAASNKMELTKKDKVLAPKINWITKQVNKVNKMLEVHNKN